MPIGDMPLYRKGLIRGEAVLTTALTPVDICGLGNPKVGRLILDTPSIPRGQLVAAYLELAVVTSDPRLARWKLWLDGFALTREFKPQVSAELDGGVFSKIMFDVTPVYRSEDDKHHVTITCSGTEPMSVKHVGLVLLRRAEEAEQSYAYMSGAYAIPPGDMVEIPVELEELDGKGWVHIVGVMPSKQAAIRVEVNGSSYTMGGVAGADELVLRDLDLGPHVNIRVIHEKPGTPYYPKHFVLSSIMVGLERCLEPRITVEEAAVLGGEVHVKLSNNGASTPDSMLIIVMNSGVPVARVQVDPLKPGEEEEFSVPLPSIRGKGFSEAQRLRVRIVYRKLSRTRFTDFYLTPPGS